MQVNLTPEVWDLIAVSYNGFDNRDCAAQCGLPSSILKVGKGKSHGST